MKIRKTGAQRVQQLQKEYNRLIHTVERQKERFTKRGYGTAAIDKILEVSPWQAGYKKSQYSIAEQRQRLTKAINEIRSKKSKYQTYTIKGYENLARRTAKQMGVQFKAARRKGKDMLEAEYYEDRYVYNEDTGTYNMEKQVVGNKLMSKAMNAFHEYWVQNHNTVQYMAGSIEHVLRFIKEEKLKDSSRTEDISTAIFNRLENLEQELEEQGMGPTYDPGDVPPSLK